MIKNRFNVPIEKSKATVDCDSIHFCVCVFFVSVSSCCVLVYMLTYVYECIRGTKFSYMYNESEKFQYILIIR